MKTIGIIGGMGPEATADIYMRIIRIYQEEYGAVLDQDFPTILIYSLPIPDVVESVESRKVTEEMINDAITKLESIGAELIIIVCISAYSFTDIKPKVSELIKREIKPFSKVGLLSTTITAQTFKDLKLIQLNNDEQKELTQVIINILSGKKFEIDKNIIKRLINNLAERGAEAVIIGCTDLPLIINQKDTSTKLINVNDILARYVVNQNENR